MARTSELPPATEPAPVSAPVMGRGLQLALLLGAMVLLIAAPFVMYPVFIMKILCFALFAAAFNLLLGYTGLLSFGHAAFFGGAAYFTAHAAKVWGLGPELALLVGVAGAAVMGLVMGAIAIRRQGIYFAMVTLALSQMFFFACLQMPFTHGEDGIQSVPRGRLFGVIDLNDMITMYFFVLAVFVIGLLIIWRFVNSPFGMILKAIRENEARATSLGYATAQYKLGAFVMSATLAGLADGPDRRYRHHGRAGGRRGGRRGAAKPAGDLDIPGHHHHRAGVHGLRHAVPPRPGRRTGPFPPWPRAGAAPAGLGRAQG